MAGYWPSFFFFFLECLWTETNAKKRLRRVSSRLDRTNLVNKGFITRLSGKFFLRDTASSPERARWFHLARSGSQSQRAIWVILHARGASHIITKHKSSIHFFLTCIPVNLKLSHSPEQPLPWGICHFQLSVCQISIPHAKNCTRVANVMVILGEQMPLPLLLASRSPGHTNICPPLLPSVCPRA